MGDRIGQTETGAVEVVDETKTYSAIGTVEHVDRVKVEEKELKADASGPIHYYRVRLDAKRCKDFSATCEDDEKIDNTMNFGMQEGHVEVAVSSDRFCEHVEEQCTIHSGGLLGMCGDADGSEKMFCEVPSFSRRCETYCNPNIDSQAHVERCFGKREYAQKVEFMKQNLGAESIRGPMFTSVVGTCKTDKTGERKWQWDKGYCKVDWKSSLDTGTGYKEKEEELRCPIGMYASHREGFGWFCSKPKLVCGDWWPRKGYKTKSPLTCEFHSDCVDEKKI